MKMNLKAGTAVLAFALIPGLVWGQSSSFDASGFGAQITEAKEMGKRMAAQKGGEDRLWPSGNPFIDEVRRRFAAAPTPTADAPMELERAARILTGGRWRCREFYSFRGWNEGGDGRVMDYRRFDGLFIEQQYYGDQKVGPEASLTLARKGFVEATGRHWMRILDESTLIHEFIAGHDTYDRTNSVSDPFNYAYMYWVCAKQAGAAE
ncbi:MAG: hypothetical protein HY928_14670 [Elusimicrobia bacterium]|nr:hypothetical protein [Elusimicrobiota bacterium]